MFTKTVETTLGDTGFFLQVRRGALLDKAHLGRLDWLADNGFPKISLVEQGVEARITHDRIDYLDSTFALEKLGLQLALAGLSEDGSAFRICCRFLHVDGTAALQVLSEGFWQSCLDQRPTLPPPALCELLRQLEKTADFEVLSSALR